MNSTNFNIVVEYPQEIQDLIINSLYKSTGDFMSISIYFLRSFGIGAKSVQALSEDGLELVDLFVNFNQELNEKYSKRKLDKLQDSLLNALESIKNHQNIFDDMCMLESIGCNIRNNKIYKQTNSINDLESMLDVRDWGKDGLLASSKKVRPQIKAYKELLQSAEIKPEVVRWQTFMYFLNNTYLTKDNIEGTGFSIDIVEELFSKGLLVQSEDETQFILAFENIKFIEELKSLYNLDRNHYEINKEVIKPEEEIEISLDEFLSTKFKYKDYFLKRLDGQTLQGIGDSNGISKERVRQILNRIISNLPNIKEINEFKELYTRYDISKEVFRDFFCKDSRIYELLGLIFKRGKQDITELIVDGDYDNDQVQTFLNKSKRLLIDGEVQALTRENLIIEVLYKNRNLQKYFKVDDLHYLFTEEMKEYPQLQFKSPRSLGSQLERYNNVIFSLKKGYRYHLAHSLDKYKEDLESLFIDLPEGSYHMDYIFEKNPDLMKQLDIIDGSELHYFCKKNKLFPKIINLGRNPEFVRGEQSKREYLASELSRFDRHSIDEFIEYLNLNFGLNKDSISSYLFSEFGDVIRNRTIYFKTDKYSEEVDRIRPLLTKDIYEFNEFINILKKIDAFSVEKPDLILELGFVHRSEIVFKREYKTAMEAMSSHILSQRIFRLNNQSFLGTRDYYNTIYKLEKEILILKIAEDAYINVTSLVNRGFDRQKFRKFVSKVEKYVGKGEYFSIVSLLNDGFDDILIQDGFELISLDRLINTSDVIKSVGQGFPNIYCKSEIKKNLNDFLSDMLLEYGSVNIDDFTYDLNLKYGLNLDEYDVKNRIIDNGAFYSKELNKAYVLKEDYLDEVYG